VAEYRLLVSLFLLRFFIVLVHSFLDLAYAQLDSRKILRKSKLFVNMLLIWLAQSSQIPNFDTFFHKLFYYSCVFLSSRVNFKYVCICLNSPCLLLRNLLRGLSMSEYLLLTLRRKSTLGGCKRLPIEHYLTLCRKNLKRTKSWLEGRCNTLKKIRVYSKQNEVAIICRVDVSGTERQLSQVPFNQYAPPPPGVSLISKLEAWLGED
jgi:hypothetical protein